MFSIILIIIWALFIIAFVFQTFVSWRFFLHYHQKNWAKGLSSTPKSENKPILIWFRDNLIDLALVVFFNLFILYCYIDVVYIFAKPICKPEYFVLWMILALVTGLGGGFLLCKRCLYAEWHILEQRSQQKK